MASITCRNGETFPKTHTHNSVVAVRGCQGAPSSWGFVESSWIQGLRKDNQARSESNTLKAALSAVDSDPKPRMVEPVTPILGTLPVKPDVIRTSTSRVDPELEAKVPDGRYAIELEGAIKFYRVRKVTSGPWSGRTFVDQQASDETFPVRFAAQRAKILTAIAADVKAAAIRYGRELGQCSQCGRTLTNPESIQLGIGPICLARVS